MRKFILAAAVIPAMLVAAPLAADNHGGASELAAALAADARTADRARDEFRNPAGTLNFFKVEPGMTVADVVPGSGWYSRVLIPYLGKGGTYIGLNPDMSRANSQQVADNWGGYAAKFAQALAGWNVTGANAMGANLNEMGDDAAGTVDRVLIFREMHNLHRFELLHSTLDGARKVLKDDGMLGIVQHRAKPWAPAEYTDGSKGYMRQQDVIAMVEAHGFDLVATSEINANPKDTADHPRGVWEMKPSWGSKRPELENLGESDRMTLLFRKRP
ncbi:hypothetical protein [Altererythrobacter aquiaggeris]|uniref:class I SAM-dependent methyltransferase n=1 Tax=Aestuarierythrobacter aquiaggeris TaxID=1898396 RepID=UPI003016635D